MTPKPVTSVLTCAVNTAPARPTMRLLHLAALLFAPAAARTRIFDQMSQGHIDFMLSKIPRGRFLELDEAARVVQQGPATGPERQKARSESAPGLLSSGRRWRSYSIAMLSRADTSLMTILGLQAGIAQCLDRGGHTVMAKRIGVACLFE